MTQAPEQPSAPTAGPERTRTTSRTPGAGLLPAWLTGYRREWLRPDIVAGVVISSIIVPQAVAYAQIAGLPPQAGLIAAPGRSWATPSSARRARSS
jgi:hypothetical protein